MERVVVITGASGGLGRQLALRHGGDTVCSVSLDNPHGYENFFECDVTDAENVKRVFSEIFDKFKRIDIIYVNAGVGMAGALELTDTEKFKSVTDVNFYGAYHTMKYALPYLKKDSRIVSISSVSGLFPLPYRSAYCASKAAQGMLSLCLSMELKKKGIFSVNICPGEIATPFVKNRVIDGSTNEFYGDDIQRMLMDIEKKQSSRMSVHYASKKITGIALKRRPKKFYIIGFKYKMFYIASKLLPSNLFYKLLHNFMK